MAAFSTLAAVGLGAASLYGASKQASAAKAQANAIAAGNDAATAEQRRQFDITQAYFDPLYRDSRAASNVYMTALGIPTMTGSTQPAPGSPGSTGLYDYRSYVEGNPDLKAEFGRVGAQFGGDESAYGKFHYETFGRGEGRPLQTMTGGTTPTTGGAQAPAMTQQSIQDAVRQTPGYQAQLSEGLKAIDRAAPLRGGSYSGRRLRALESEGQRTFGSYYDNWLSRVGGVAGQGSGVAGSITNAGQATANNVSNLMTSSAAARGDAKINSANSWMSGLGSAAGIIGGQQGWWK